MQLKKFGLVTRSSRIIRVSTTASAKISSLNEKTSHKVAAHSVVKVSKHEGKHAKKYLSRDMPAMISSYSLLRSKKSELMKKQAEFDSKYVFVSGSDIKDERPFVDSIKLVSLEMEVIRNAIKSIMGRMKAFKITLPEVYFFVSNSGSVTAASLPLDPSTLTEFAALADLFDEYKVLGGEYVYSVNDWHVPSTTIAAQGVLAYDPSDGTAPASLVSLSAKQQHTLVAYGTSVAGLTSLTLVHSGNSRFKYSVPSGSLVAAGATASQGSSNWQPTLTTNGYQPYGWLKFYKAGSHASTDQLSGIVYHHCEFRSRQ